MDWTSYRQRRRSPHFLHRLLVADLHHLAMVRKSPLRRAHHAALPIQVTCFLFTSTSGLTTPQRPRCDAFLELFPMCRYRPRSGAR